MEADISSQAVGLASSADFSLMNLFIRADIVVKSVIIVLIAIINFNILFKLLKEELLVKFHFLNLLCLIRSVFQQ